jgi:hypothetical protein
MKNKYANQEHENKVQNESLLNNNKKMRILTMMDINWNHIND